jgi:hypothetical protein
MKTLLAGRQIRVNSQICKQTSDFPRERVANVDVVGSAANSDVSERHFDRRHMIRQIDEPLFPNVRKIR